MRGIQVRAELTEEWKKRAVGSSQDYAILTAEISKATIIMVVPLYYFTDLFSDAFIICKNIPRC